MARRGRTSNMGAEPVARKGARTRAAIPADVLERLSVGEIPSATLVEILALDFTRLARSAGLTAAEAERIASAGGIMDRMRVGGQVLAARHGASVPGTLAEHPSDTVRGWVAFAVGAAPGLDLKARLARIRLFADDGHSGVREWAWLAVRGAIGADVERAIGLLTPWTAERSANLRRFASEATRPRGVWCAHVSELRADPSRGLPILEPLRSDGSVYVQDSVANWLNDASKDEPALVRRVCARWRAESGTEQTERICRRALRTVTKSTTGKRVKKRAGRTPRNGGD